jgi:hypothetical protein
VATISVKVRFERPVNFKQYARSFIRTYNTALFDDLEKNSKKFETAFIKLHDKRDSRFRKLGPNYTGAQRSTISAEVERLPAGKIILAGNALMTVGYQSKQFRGRQSVYVPAIEGGWGGGNVLKKVRGLKTVKRGKLVRPRLLVGLHEPAASGERLKTILPGINDARVTQKLTKLGKQPRVSKRGSFDIRVEEWARQRLRIFPDNDRGKARLYFLKRAIRAGANGRNVVGRYAHSPEVARLWNQVNDSVLKKVAKEFRFTQKDKKVFTATIARGSF